MNRRTVEVIDRTDEFIHIILGLVLLLTAFFLLVQTVITGVEQFLHRKDVVHTALLIIKDLLFVMIVLEMLWLVLNYIQTKKVNVEPFIVIGIISSIRKILVITAQPFEEAIMQKPEIFKMQMKELILETVIVFVLVVALLLIRYSKRWIRKEV